MVVWILYLDKKEKKMEVLLIIIAWGCVCGGIGAAIGSRKGRAGLGFFLGFVLGFIGWIIIACLSPIEVKKVCPQCGNTMAQTAKICPVCKTGEELHLETKP